MKLYHFANWPAIVLGALFGCWFAGQPVFATTNEFNPAKSLVIREWGTEKGLPQNTVNVIIQTSDGYLWLGTQEGLARFDGMRFTVFGLQDGLPSVEVHAICEDKAGIIWIGTSDGLSRLMDGQIETISLPPRLGAVVTTLEVDADDRLWIGTRNGLCLYQNGHFIEDELMSGLSPMNVQDVKQDHAGNLWIACESHGLLEFHDHQFTQIIGPPGLEQIFAHCLLVDQSSNLWISIGNGVVLRRDQNAQWITYNESNGVPFAYVSCLAQEADGTIWAGSLYEGLYRFEAGSGSFTAIKKEQGLSANDIRSLCPDREGNLWIGTRSSGLNRLSRSKLAAYGVAQGLTNDYTRGVAESADGTLWVGTIDGGLYLGKAGQFTKSPNEEGTFYYAFIDSVLATPDGSVWYGARHGLLRLRDGKLTNYSTNALWSSTTVSALCDDQHGGIWIGTTDSRLIHFQNEQFTLFPDRVARGSITSLTRQTNGTLWVGSEAGGLIAIQPDGHSIRALTNGLLSQSIRTLRFDNDGSTLWIGTLGGGLSRYLDGQIVTFTTQQGLWADTISQIVPDNNGNLWCGCNHGIFRVSKKELNLLATGQTSFIHPRVFGLNDGMLAEECSGGFAPAGLATKAGLICFSTVKGLVLVDPESHTKNLPRSALLEEIKVVEGQTHHLEKPLIWLGKDGKFSSQVIIPHGAWEVELHYTSINLSSPETVLFRYRLKNLDKDWIEAGGRRTAYYPGIPPGNYTFEVNAGNADGIWSDQKATVDITVQPYFWETLWFRITAGVGSVILIIWLVRNRYRHRLARLEMQHAVEKERVRIAKDIHDDIGGILTQVSQISDLGLGQSEAQKQPTLKNQFERIGHQARAAVQSLDEIVWATNPRNDNLPRFAEYVSRFADEYFENSEVRCWQEVPTDLPDLPLRSNVRHNVFLAIKEAFTNILKHSGASEVWLRISLLDGNVRIEIEDNGCGFKPDKITSGGNGLDNMKTRLEECSGKKEMISLSPHGTKIRLIFPLPNAA